MRFAFFRRINCRAVQSTHNNCFYAIKVLNKEKIVKLKQVEHTNNERELLMSCKHDFLINLWGTFQDRNNLFMVMEFVGGGDLFTLIRKSVVGHLAILSRHVSLIYLSAAIPQRCCQILRGGGCIGLGVSA